MPMMLYIFIFGLFIGSFLNCVIYRTEKGKSFLKGRSFCPHCRRILHWQDLVPVLSYAFLRGKCRHCRKKISIQYPLVELATGILFVLVFLLSGFGIWDFINICFFFLASCFLIIIFVYDLKHFIIPDKFLFPLIGIVVIYRIFEFLSQSNHSVLNYLFSAIFASAFFLTIYLISRGKWMGFGDVKLAFFMGFFLGYPNIIGALFFAFMIGAIIGLGLIFMHKKTLKSEVPFGPFLIASTFIFLFWGAAIINWYFNLITF
jgi:prepilin signal peptidase PulO-like enzyme (type II secretory pathway)